MAVACLGFACDAAQDGRPQAKLGRGRFVHSVFLPRIRSGVSAHQPVFESASPRDRILQIVCIPSFPFRPFGPLTRNMAVLCRLACLIMMVRYLNPTTKIRQRINGFF